MSDGPLSLHLQAWLIAALIVLHAVAANPGPLRLDVDAGADEGTPAAVSSCASTEQDGGYLSRLAAFLVRTSGGEGTELPGGGC